MFRLALLLRFALALAGPLVAPLAAMPATAQGNAQGTTQGNAQGTTGAARTSSGGGASLQDTISRAVAPVADADTSRDLAETDQLIGRWERQLEVYRLIGGRTDLDQDQLAVIRSQILDTKTSIDARRRSLDVQVAELHDQLDSLGPPPVDTEEPATVARRRAELSDRMAQVEARHKEIGLLVAQSDQLIDRIGVARVTELRERLFTSYPAPVRPSVFLAGLREGVALLGRIVAAPLSALADGFKRDSLERDLPMVAAVAIVVVAIWLAALFWLEPRFGQAGTPRSHSRKVVAAVVNGLSRGVAPALLIAAPLMIVLRLNMMSGLAESTVTSAGEALVRFIVLTGLIRATLAPDAPDWRLPNFSDEAARAIWRRALVLLTTLHVALFLIQVAQQLDISPELRSSFALVFSLLMATNLLALLRGSYWEPEATVPETGSDDPEDSRAGIDPGTVARWLLALVALAAVGFAIVGYSQAAIWLLSKLIDIGFLILVLVLVRGVLRDLVGIVQDKRTRPHAWVGRIAGADDVSIDRFVFWFNMLVDFASTLIGVAGVALIVGVGVADIYLLSVRALEGFQVGSVQVSPGTLIAGVFAFFVALVITRLIQRGLVRSIFPHTQIDTGVQHSVTAGIGYIGVTIALFIAVGVVGIDLSNLALIAGALSVGIGFGLQAIVNNFVSGLILLAERPVKVGDWVKVGAFEGTVKRINVRATEIQTFQRSEVIIPNSELISSAIVNYTHKDKVGRIEIAVPVSYGVDPKAVGEILLEIANDHPMVAPWPEPYLYFHAFDEVAMRLELRVYLIDINNFMIVTNDLHFSIAERLRAAGIPFPRPHTDTRLRRDDVQDRVLAAGPRDGFSHNAPEGGEMDS